MILAIRKKRGTILAIRKKRAMLHRNNLLARLLSMQISCKLFLAWILLFAKSVPCCAATIFWHDSCYSQKACHAAAQHFSGLDFAIRKKRAMLRCNMPGFCCGATKPCPPGTSSSIPLFF